MALRPGPVRPPSPAWSPPPRPPPQARTGKQRSVFPSVPGQPRWPRRPPVGVCQRRDPRRPRRSALRACGPLMGLSFARWPGLLALRRARGLTAHRLVSGSALRQAIPQARSTPVSAPPPGRPRHSEGCQPSPFLCCARRLALRGRRQLAAPPESPCGRRGPESQDVQPEGPSETAPPPHQPEARRQALRTRHLTSPVPPDQSDQGPCPPDPRICVSG